MRARTTWHALLAASALACGGGSGASDAGTPVDAAADVAIDAPADALPDISVDASAYPAFTPEMPKVVDNGGVILAAPKIVTVTWNDDPNQSLLDAFGDGIGQSAYWQATTSEYGVGAATSDHVHISTSLPQTMTDAALEKMIADQVDAAPGSGWPVDDASTVYVVYVPEAMELTSGNANDCNIEDGYHDEMQTQTVSHLVYAVVNEGCHDTQDVVSFTTEVASHEMVESATDPHAETDLAYAGFDEDHYAWEQWNQRQDELADACEYFAEANYESTAPFDDWLQRSWSNAGAAAGHDPCVPAPAGAYYNATPLGLDSISITLKNGSLATKGYSIGVGTKRTVQIGLYSDAPHAPWTVNVVEGDGFSTPVSHVTIAQTVTSGQNGDVLDVDITTKSTKASGVLVTVVSSASGEPTHYMPFLVATE